MTPLFFDTSSPPPPHLASLLVLQDHRIHLLILAESLHRDCPNPGITGKCGYLYKILLGVMLV